MQSLGSFLTACCCEIRGQSWLKWQVFLSSHSPSTLPGLKAQLAAPAPGLSCRHFWLEIAFLFTQFSSTCSYQCFWEATGKTEESRLWVFYCWRWSIQVCAQHQLPLSTHFLKPHTLPDGAAPLPTLLHGLLTQLLFSSLFPTWCQTKEGTWILTSLLFIPSCSDFQLPPCMVPRIKVLALPPNPVCPT